MSDGNEKSPDQVSSPPATDFTPQNSKPVVGANIFDDDGTAPDFIYGGPWIKKKKPTPFLDTTTPINMQLQGTFKKSFAYYSLKERLPVILTKVIDYLSREQNKISSQHKASAEDITGLIKYISKLKNDLVTNKKYDLFTVDSAEARKWNEWIQQLEHPRYFTNTWVWTECYVYRRLREGCELSKGLQDFDPFDEQKDKSFQSSMEPMCVVADRVLAMLAPSEKDKRKADFITLLKLSLWSNKCDLSLSAGELVSMKGPDRPSVPPKEAQKDKKGAAEPPRKSVTGFIDPLQMIVDFKDKLLVDDSAKIADLVVSKADAMRKAVDGPAPAEPPASEEGAPEAEAKPEAEAPAKVPCPAKVTVPSAVMFDIVCDNAGYELFTDLCLAHFLISQKIVQKVRFHVKKIPWFVSDVTPRDFRYVIDSCREANFSKDPPASEEDEAPEESKRPLTAGSLQQLGEQWTQYLENGTFVVVCDDFWTSPHVFKDMKKYDSNLYRKLQLAVAILFKGDLNYRKLLGERNCNPTLGFDAALQGFNPAPVIALRTVKADLICGLPRGKWDQLTRVDDKWMEKGDYGVIQLSPKAEPLKVSDKPCADYGDTCRGTACPVQEDM